MTQEVYRTAVRALRRPRAAARPAPPGRGPGRGAGRRARRCTASCVLGEREHGWSRGRPGRRPGGPPVRLGRGPPRQPAAREPGTGRDVPRCLTNFRVSRLPRITSALPRLAGYTAPQHHCAWLEHRWRNRCRSPKRSSDCSSRWSAPSSRRTPSSPPPCAAPRCGARARRRAIVAGVVFVVGVVVLMTGAIARGALVGRHRRLRDHARPPPRSRVTALRGQPAPGRGRAALRRPPRARLHRHRRRPRRPAAAAPAAPVLRRAPSWSGSRTAGAAAARRTAASDPPLTGQPADGRRTLARPALGRSRSTGRLGL